MKLWFLVGALVIVLLIIAVLALAVALGVETSNGGESSSDEQGGGQQSSVCLTPECVKLSAMVLSGLDETIDPCEDFYNFSCGNWVQNTIIPDGEYIYTWGILLSLTLTGSTVFSTNVV